MKKFIASLLLIALLVPLAACGEEDSVSDTTADTAQSDAPQTTAAEYTAPSVNYDGKTFTVAGMDASSLDYVISSYQMIAEEENSEIINDSIVKMTLQVEEELGVNLKNNPYTFNDRSALTDITKTVYAGLDEYQAVFPVAAGLKTLLSNPSVLADLSSFTTLDFSRSWWDQASIEEYRIGGVLYAAKGDICFFSKGAPLAVFFNTSMAADFRLDNPYQLVYDGKWTMDRMIEMASAVANDINGNQKVDEKDDRFGAIFERSSLGYMLMGSGVDFSRRGEKDTIEITLYDERTLAIVEKMVPFLRTKNTVLLDVDFYGSYSNPFTDLFTPTFMENRSLFFTNQLLQALDFRAMEADFGILPLPKFEEEQSSYYSTSNTSWEDYLIVPVTNQAFEMTGHVLDAMGYYSQQYVTPAFIETSVLGKSVRDDDSAKMVELIYDTHVYDVARIFGWGGINSMINTLVDNSSTALASEYAKIESAIMEAMKNTMNELLKN